MYDRTRGSAALESGSSEEIDWELLRASLLRSEGKVEESNGLLLRLATIFAPMGRPEPFQLRFQRALNFFIVDDFVTAMEEFLRAHALATSPWQRASALMNVVTCRENLNLPYERALVDLRREIDLVVDEELAAPVLSQLRAFEDRHSFRTGHIDEIFKRDVPEKLEQTHLYRLWLMRLPYFKRRERHAVKRLLEVATSGQNLHRKAYHLKTALADSRLPDETGVETALAVDRIYLWTWLWLENPSELNRSNLASLLERFDFSEAKKKMTFEDFQMIRNALSWIAIFQAPLREWIGAYLARFNWSDLEVFPVFEMEWLHIQRLKALRTGRSDARAQALIDRHPLSGVPEIDFPVAERTLRATVKLEPPGKGNLTVREGSCEVSRGRKRVISEAIAKLLLSLAQDPVLTFEQALWTCFGISPYDEAVHSAKIRNLLFRLKGLLPSQAEIKTRSGVIYAHGLGVHVIERPALEKQLFDNRFSLGKMPSSAARIFARPLQPRALAEKARGQELFTRGEIEKLLGVSKASAARWIQKWREKGLISEQGSGRARRYRLEIRRDYRLSSID